MCDKFRGKPGQLANLVRIQNHKNEIKVMICQFVTDLQRADMRSSQVFNVEVV